VVGTSASVSPAAVHRFSLMTSCSVEKSFGAQLFYLGSDQLAGYAENGSLKAYGDLLSNKDDFYPSLVSVSPAAVHRFSLMTSCSVEKSFGAQ
jgi:multiple sugar transport system substrate-binding protein